MKNRIEKLWHSFGYSSYIRERYEMICPYGKRYLEELTGQMVRTVLIGAFLSSVILVFWNLFFYWECSLYLCGSVMLGCYLVAMEFPNREIQRREMQLYQELLLYLSRVKHRYMIAHHIPNAVYDASEHMGYEVIQHAKELYRILMAADREEKVKEYVVDRKGNRYLKLFLVQAFEASEKGDTCMEGEDSLFCENVEHLRLEIMEELYRQKKRSHEFAGYIFVSVTPVFMMPVLKQWGIEFAAELTMFYEGLGKILELATLFGTAVIYFLINRAKNIALHTGGIQRKEWLSVLWNGTLCKKAAAALERMQGKYSKKIRVLLLQSGEVCSFGKFCVKMFGMAICSMLILALLLSGIHRNERRAILETVSAIDTIAPLASEQKKEAITGQILSIVSEYKNQKTLEEREVEHIVKERLRLSNQTMQQAVTDEVLNKITQYKEAHMQWSDALLCIVAGSMIGLLPLFRIWYQVQAAMDGAVYEVRQFYSVILMERNLKGVTIPELLEDMEIFSSIFKGTLRRCINAYSAGPEQALLRMKEEGGKIHGSFAELADAFLSVDDVGIANAFAEVEHNRGILDKISQLEAEITMEKKRDSTDLITKIPMALTVGGYFVVPFFGYALKGVFEVFTLLEELRM